MTSRECTSTEPWPNPQSGRTARGLQPGLGHSVNLCKKAEPSQNALPWNCADPSQSTRRSRRRNAAQTGSLNILTLGYVVIALLAAVVLLDVSSVYLDHKKLLSLADGAASAAADAFDITGIAGDRQGHVTVRLDDGRVRAAAADYLRRSPAAVTLDGLALVDASGSPDGRSATVRLTAVARPPLLGVFVPDGITIESGSTARARLVR
ncbi:pilus assembly protein TadG-related protein [Arthrobacter sp. RCC_34]|uniref:pilus assembly protein TadG-related protein n=1 Tax=Arthrobacter sp. RCC_34 TaxID=3239230 RepID=UPI003526037E